MPVQTLTVSIVDSAAEALVTISGELDTVTCSTLRASLEPVLGDSTGDVVVDLSEVVFADSAALHLLVDVSLELFADGRRLIVVDPSRPVVRLLSLADVLMWFAPRGDTRHR